MDGLLNMGGPLGPPYFEKWWGVGRCRAGINVESTENLLQLVEEEGHREGKMRNPEAPWV